MESQQRQELPARIQLGHCRLRNRQRGRRRPARRRPPALPEKTQPRSGVLITVSKCSAGIRARALPRLQFLVNQISLSWRTWEDGGKLSKNWTWLITVRELLQRARLAGEYGGIQVEAKSGAGSLDTTHIMFDETA